MSLCLKSEFYALQHLCCCTKGMHRKGLVRWNPSSPVLLLINSIGQNPESYFSEFSPVLNFGFFFFIEVTLFLQKLKCQRTKPKGIHLSIVESS